MKTVVQIDQAGRVVLPKGLRERFRLHGGDTLILEVKGEDICLRPQQTKDRLQRINGVLVLVSAAALPERRDLVDESRNERLDELAHRPEKNESFLRH